MRYATEAEKEEVLFNDDIWRKVSNGVEISKKDYVLPKSWLYLTETGKEIIIVSNSNYVHPNVLPGYRSRSFWVLKRALNWIKLNTDIDTLLAKIHKKHENAIKISKILGFRVLSVENDRFNLELRFDK